MSPEEKKDFRSGFAAIIGRPNVGKSTLLNRILGQKIAITSSKPQTTRNRILGVAHLEDAQIMFLDTPGIHQAQGRLNRFMVEQAMGACSEVDLILYLIDASEPSGQSQSEDLILEHLRQCGRPVFLVINKIDAIPRAKLLPMIERYAKRFPFAEVIPISAATGDGVERLVNLVRAALPVGPAYYP